MQEARKHHFVPELILRPWLTKPDQAQSNIRGYWWDQHHNCLGCKQRGMKSFCFQIDLLRLSHHALGRDVIERRFFGHIDTRGASTRDVLLSDGPKKMTVEQRCDFARLLLSLEARRPVIVKKLRDSHKYLENVIDTDPDIALAMTEDGSDGKPSEYVECHLGQSIEDRMVLNIRKLVDNPAVGRHLINAHWMVKHLDQHDGTLVLSDRPLIRIYGCDRPGSTWVLPLTPHAAFIACNSKNNFLKLENLSGQRFVKVTNTSSAAQAERFVFCVDRSHEQWLGKYLKSRSCA